MDELCGRCSSREAVKLLGTIAYCYECSEAFLEPLRRKWQERPDDELEATIAPLRRNQSGMRTCAKCGATWIGEPQEPCKWCIRREREIVEDQRRELLNPSFSAMNTYESWTHRLGLAVVAGIITQLEGEKALRRCRTIEDSGRKSRRD